MLLKNDLLYIVNNIYTVFSAYKDHLLVLFSIAINETELHILEIIKSFRCDLS